MLYYTEYNSPIGKLIIQSDGENIIGVYKENQKYFTKEINEIQKSNNIDILIKTKKWLDRYFSGEKPLYTELNLNPIGSNFRQIVWKLLLEIPYGEVTTYGAIAKKVAKIMNKEKMSAQAIGGAVGHNPISIIIPCHRVIGANGNLTGYAGGIETKKKLLELENADINKDMVHPEGFEPPTFRFVAERSIQLSYECIIIYYKGFR